MSDCLNVDVAMSTPYVRLFESRAEVVDAELMLVPVNVTPFEADELGFFSEFCKEFLNPKTTIPATIKTTSRTICDATEPF